eukprot:766211-Hanusia_phi.AAC.4
MSAPIPALEMQKSGHPHLAAMYDKIQTSAANKLWHQATLALEELCKDACFSEEVDRWKQGSHRPVQGSRGRPGDGRMLLETILTRPQPSSASWTGFASKINPVKHASLCIRVSLQYGDSEEGIKSAIAFLEQVGTKLESDTEAYLLVRLEISRRFLQSGKIDVAKSKLEVFDQGDDEEVLKVKQECKDVLVDFAEIDANVNSSFYLVSSLLHKTLGDAGEFYKSSLLYLAYTPLESLSEEKRQVRSDSLNAFLGQMYDLADGIQALAFDLGLAAICAEKIYQVSYRIEGLEE